MMHFVGSTGINIEGNTYLCKAGLDLFMVFINNLLGANTFLQSPDCDRNPVFITATNKFYIPFFCSLVTYINIRRYIAPGQVPDMQWTIGVGQGSGNQYSFIVSHFQFLLFIFTLFLHKK